MKWELDGEPRPGILVLPPDAASLDEAYAAIELWEHYSRKTLDPSQRLAVCVMMAETAGGRWAARTTGREMPRQNGKGEEFEVVELWGLVMRGEAILHSAHELRTVSSAHQRMVSLTAHRDFKSKRGKVLNGIGQQLIEFKGGGVIAYCTRTAGGGRGLDDISRLIVDEAQHAKPEQLASATPILLVNPNPQTNFAGTGAIKDVSDWWWEIRIRALGDNPGDFGYVGHTAEKVYLVDDEVKQDKVDPHDRANWYAANPVLHYGRGEEKFFEEQLRTLGPALFAREHLGVWDPPPVGTSGVFPKGKWAGCHRAGTGPVGQVDFALDMSPARDAICLAVAAQSALDGVHVEIVKHGPNPGTKWICDEALRLQAEYGGQLVLVKGSPAHALMADLVAAGVDVREVEAAEYVQACGDFFDAVVSGQIAHLDQAELNDAVRGVEKKWTGDAWYWARRTSVSDITPLVAVTIARWAHLHGAPALSVW